MRTVVAFFVAPLIGVMVFVAWSLGPVLVPFALDLPPTVTGMLFWEGLKTQLLVYIITIVISVPVFLLVRSKRALTWWSSMLAALFIEGLVLLPLGLGAFNLMVPRILIGGVLMAIAYGLAFWVIADYRRSPPHQ